LLVRIGSIKARVDVRAAGDDETVEAGQHLLQPGV
jgi:hypothetical protein